MQPVQERGQSCFRSLENAGIPHVGSRPKMLVWVLVKCRTVRKWTRRPRSGTELMAITGTYSERPPRFSNHGHLPSPRRHQQNLGMATTSSRVRVFHYTSSGCRPQTPRYWCQRSIRSTWPLPELLETGTWVFLQMCFRNKRFWRRCSSSMKIDLLEKVCWSITIEKFATLSSIRSSIRNKYCDHFFIISSSSSLYVPLANKTDIFTKRASILVISLNERLKHPCQTPSAGIFRAYKCQQTISRS